MRTIGIPVRIDPDNLPDDPVAAIYYSLSDALVLSCIRTHGQIVAADVEAEFGRRQQSALLAELPSGLMSEEMPLTELCARAQFYCDRRNGCGARLGQFNDEKTWIWYPDGHWMGAGLIRPSASAAVLAPEMGRAWYESRHGTTTEKLGNGQVQFVLAMDTTKGAPFDAGYFARRPSGESASSVFVPQAEEFPGLCNGHLETIAPDDPGSSQAISWRTAALRMKVLSEMLGIVGSTSIVEHAWRIVLGAYWFWLPEITGQANIDLPVHAARLVSGIMTLEGEEATIEDADSGCLLSRSVGHWLDEGVPLPVLGGIARAWSAILPNFEWKLRMVDVDTTPEGQITSLFDFRGPYG